MTLYLHHNFVLIRETYPESLEKNRQGDGELRHVTSFPYIFPYYDVIDKNADVSEKNDVMEHMMNEIEFTYGALQSR